VEENLLLVPLPVTGRGTSGWGLVMLFDLNPKTRREDLYDRESELKEIFSALDLGERFIVIYGVRRVGKTSLLRVALREAGVLHAIIDVRKVYFEHRSVSKIYLYKEVANYFAKNLSLFRRLGFKVKDFFKRLKGFHITQVGVEVEPIPQISFTDLLERINDWCERRNLRFVLSFDEAQYLRFSGKVRYDGIFAWCIDNLPNVTIIVTGSEVELLREFLRINDPKAPLFGRYMREIYVDRFTRDQSIDFLKQGFKELGVEPNIEEIEEVVERFDGIVGWLTHYGYYRAVKKMNHEASLREVFEKGSQLELIELEKLIAPSRKRYTAILKAVAQGATTWSDIKTYLIVKTGYIDDKTFTQLLKNLVKHGYLVKENNKYKIPDPIVEYLVKEKLQ